MERGDGSHHSEDSAAVRLGKLRVKCGWALLPDQQGMRGPQLVGSRPNHVPDERDVLATAAGP